jgi:hypothetical protein
MNGFADALIRHLTIDACLRDTTKQHTLVTLIDACSQALITRHKGKIKNNYKVSTRTLQLDLQFMRDKKNGYGAPIVVYNQKFYKYKKENYTILNSKLNKEIFSEIAESINTLNDFTNFSHLNSIKENITSLKQGLALIESGNQNIFSHENVGSIKDTEYISQITEAICNKQTLCINYYSIIENCTKEIVMYPAHLKEYNKRWYIIGLNDSTKNIDYIRIDSINEINYSIIPYPDDFIFNPDEYFNNIIGISKPIGEKCTEIKLLINSKIGRLIKNNPLHSTQKVLRIKDKGDLEISINIVPNEEFYNLIDIYRPCIEVISPKSVGENANMRIEPFSDFIPYKGEGKKIKAKDIRDEIPLENLLF